MSITDAAIGGAILSQQARQLLTKVNDATASATDIAASLLSLDEKAVLNELRLGTATRRGINARELSLPFKAIALSIAGV